VSAAPVILRFPSWIWDRPDSVLARPEATSAFWTPSVEKENIADWQPYDYGNAKRGVDRKRQHAETDYRQKYDVDMKFSIV
jgi:hypothetical protein